MSEIILSLQEFMITGMVIIFGALMVLILVPSIIGAFF